MAVKDTIPNTRQIVSPLDGTRVIVENRSFIAPDHLVDSLARAHGLRIKTGLDLVAPVTRDITEHLTKVTYG